MASSHSECSDDAVDGWRVISGAYELRNTTINEHGRGSMRTSIMVPAAHITIVDGIPFIRMKTKSSNIQRLMTSGVKIRGVVRKSTIVKRLTRIKTAHVKAMIVNGKESASKAKRWRPRLKMYSVNKLQMLEVIVIVAPDVGNVTGHEMKVLATRRSGKGHGLFVELVPKNIDYISKAVAYEHEHAGHGVDDGDENDVSDHASEDDNPDDEDTPDTVIPIEPAVSQSSSSGTSIAPVALPSSSPPVSVSAPPARRSILQLLLSGGA